MIKIAASVLIVLLSSAFALLLGCSDDDKSVVKPVVPTEGELTDVRFLFAQQVCEPDIMRRTGLTFLTSTFFLMGLPTLSPARDAITSQLSLPDDLSGFVINSINTPAMSGEGWYVFEYDITVVYDGTDTTNAVGVDSVRLLKNGSPVAWTGFSTMFDARESHDRAVWSNNQAESGISRHNIDLARPDTLLWGAMSLDISVADTTHTSAQDDSGFCYVDLYETGTGTGVLLSGSQMGYTFCADSGTVATSTVVDLDCSEHSQASSWGVEGLWTSEGVYNSAYVLSFKLTHANTYWNSADTCTPQSPLSGRR